MGILIAIIVVLILYNVFSGTSNKSSSRNTAFQSKGPETKTKIQSVPKKNVLKSKTKLPE